MPKVKGIPRVRFTLFSTKDPDKETYVYLYFHYCGKRLRHITGERITPAAWDFTRQRGKASSKYPQNVDVNIRLNKLEAFTIEIYRETNFGQIEPDVFSKELDYRMGYAPKAGGQPATPTLLQFLEKIYLDRQEQPDALRKSIEIIRIVRQHLATYGEEKRRRVDYADINEDFFANFKTWLFERGLQTNYVSKIFSIIRQFMREAKQRGYHSNEAFEGFRVKKEETAKLALTLEELKELEALDLTPGLDKARDLFLIGAYTGMRFSDFSDIKPEHFYANESGKFIKKSTQKTGATVHVPVFPAAERIFEKHGYCSPELTNQAMNRYLKEIGNMLWGETAVAVPVTKGGRRKEILVKKADLLKTHVARRTFVTVLYGMPEKFSAKEIMSMTGHTSINQFQNYVRIDGELNATNVAKKAKDIF